MYKQILNYLNDNEVSKNKKQDIVLMDINLLPSEYKEGVLKDSIKQYEKDFNVKLIPYDPSRLSAPGSQKLGIEYLGRQ